MSVKRLASGRWQVDWYDVQGRRHRRSFQGQKAALAYEREMLRQRDQGETPREHNLTLEGFLAEWQAATRPSVRHHTWRGYESNVRLYILPYLGGRRLARIDTRELQRFIETLDKRKVSAAQVESTYRTLSTILNLAADYGLCQPPPRKRALRMPIRTPKVLQVPTIAQIEQLAETIDPRFRAMVLMAGYMGLREGELLGLHPRSVDWLRYRVRVYQTLERATLERVDMTKGARRKDGGERYVTMPSRVAEALSQHVKAYPSSEWVFHREGDHVEATWLHRAVWVPARRRCGLDGVRFHDLRHAAASVMASAGWGPKKVQMELGHSDPAFTLRVYGHLWAEHEEPDRLKLDETLRDALRTVAERKAAKK